MQSHPIEYVIFVSGMQEGDAEIKHSLGGALFVLLAESTSLGESALVLSRSQRSTATGSTSVVTNISWHTGGGNRSVLLGNSFINLLNNLGVPIADHWNVRLFADLISETLAV